MPQSLGLIAVLLSLSACSATRSVVELQEIYPSAERDQFEGRRVTIELTDGRRIVDATLVALDSSSVIYYRPNRFGPQITSLAETKRIYYLGRTKALIGIAVGVAPGAGIIAYTLQAYQKSNHLIPELGRAYGMIIGIGVGVVGMLIGDHIGSRADTMYVLYEARDR